MDHAYDRATAVTAERDGMYTVALDGAIGIGTAMNGGYLLAAAARAALVDDAHPDLLAVSANYLRRAVPGPTVATVERVRPGRRVSASRVLMTQEGRPWLDAVVTTGVLPDDDEPLWSELPAPDVPDPERCVPFPTTIPDGAPIGLSRLLDGRTDPTLPFLSGDLAGPPEVRAWLRFRDGREPDALALPLFADALPPVTFARGRFGWVPTVHLSLLVRGRPEPGWCLVRCRGHHATGSFLDEEFAVWDSAGRLVAQGHQLALTPRH